MRARQRERIRILVGCEGESENGYAVHLKRLADEKGLFVHVEAPILKGGDALARLEWMADYIEREQGRRAPFKDKFALLDTDQDRLSVERSVRARQLAQRIGVTVVWQEPTHEGMLLRHFDGHTTRRPALAGDAMAQLVRLWPGYLKGMAAMEYRRVLTEAHVLRASDVEPGLLSLLIAIGLVRVVG